MRHADDVRESGEVVSKRMGDQLYETLPSDWADRRSSDRTDPDLRAHHDAIFTFARAAELHDEDTGNHIQRIRLIVDCLARRMGASDAEGIGYDAMLHDVGKLMIPPEVLRKPGALTTEERLIMQTHTVNGERILSRRPTMERAARIARSHHECWDGTGYPDGIGGEAIPVEARLTAVADVLDALVASRCYKQAWSYRDAFNEVLELAGTKLDPAVVAALRACDAAGELDGVFSPSAYVDETGGSVREDIA
jgi:putative two-component system response regulator